MAFSPLQGLSTQLYGSTSIQQINKPYTYHIGLLVAFEHTDERQHIAESIYLGKYDSAST